MPPKKDFFHISLTTEHAGIFTAFELYCTCMVVLITTGCHYYLIERRGSNRGRTILSA